MEGKKRYIAIVLFLLIGLTLFAFANPVEEEKGSKKKNGNGDETQEVSKDEDTDTQGTLETESEENTQVPVQVQVAQLAEDNSYANALEAVEKAEGTFDKDDIDSAKELIDQVTNDEQKQELAGRIEIVEESLEVMTLVEKLEEMLNDSENKDDIEDTIDYRDDEEIEDKVDSLRNEEVKETLVKRLANINKVLNDTEAPSYSGIENNETTKEDVTLTVEDDTEVEIKVTLDGKEIEYKEDEPFTEEGVYEVILTDEAFNETTITFTIDKNAPAIKSNWWKKTVEANKDVEFTDFPEFTITDKTEVTTEFIKGEVKMGVPGVYRLRYRFTDAAGNSIDKEVEVTVVDTTKPSVRSNWWKKTVEANKDAVFTEFPEFTLTDNAEGEITTEFVKGEVKMGVPGVYRLRYRFTDAAGNSIDKEVEVTVVDTTAPLLTLNGESRITIEAGIGTYEELGATVTDNVDETITNLQPDYIHYRDKDDKLEKVTTVDTTKVGTYKIVYKHTDSNNNIGVDAKRADHDYVMRIVTVVDTTAPTVVVDVRKDKGITDIVASDVTKLSFKTYKDGKVVHSFNSGVNYKRFSIDWLGDGVYTVEATDEGGNITSVEAIVDHTKPVVEASYTEKTVEADKSAIFTDFPTFTITDLTNVKEELVSGNVNMGVPGNYELIYRFTDEFDNYEEIKVVIIVVDTTAPSIRSNWWKKTYEANKDAEFTDYPEFTVTDNAEGEITIEKISGEVNMGVPGAYRLRYRFTDADGNSTEKSVEATIVDTTAPSVRSDWWKKTYEADENAEFTDYPEFTVTDNAEGEITIEKISGEVNMGVPGEYRLRYRFTDASGNSTEKAVEATIIDTPASEETTGDTSNPTETPVEIPTEETVE